MKKSKNLKARFIPIAVMVMGVFISSVRAPRAGIAVPNPTSTAGVWDTMDAALKIDFIAELIKIYAENEGTVIRKEPAFYAEEIDTIRMENPNLFMEPIGAIFRTMAITYRDFDNGQDPDELFFNEFGEDMYERSLENKEAMEDIYRDWLAEQAARTAADAP